MRPFSNEFDSIFTNQFLHAGFSSSKLDEVVYTIIERRNKTISTYCGGSIIIFHPTFTRCAIIFLSLIKNKLVAKTVFVARKKSFPKDDSKMLEADVEAGLFKYRNIEYSL